MSAIARSRIFSIISKRKKRPFSSSVTTDPPKEPMISSSSFLNNQAPAPPTSPPPPPQPQATAAEKKPWNFLKYSLVAALTGGVATASYATYAYSLDEIDQKTKALRSSANYSTGDDASALDVSLT
ncbi:unnamed protein product [Ilex paraguariensis]|uniref:Uncharacterized protein n=1 Tax=Ilex paraguariensis TaxID=185542 RepID=A0ABC8U5C7_9AQUA